MVYGLQGSGLGFRGYMYPNARMVEGDPNDAAIDAEVRKLAAESPRSNLPRSSPFSRV